MLRRNEHSIGELLREYLKVTQLDNVVNADRIGRVWQECLGDDVTRETDRIYFNNGYLFVNLKSPSLRTQLLMRRTQIAHSLNEKLGSDIIKTVVIR